MPINIEPALSEEEWVQLRRSSMRPAPKINGEPVPPTPPEYLVAQIARANFALPDDDLRKITRSRLQILRNAASCAEDPVWSGLAEDAAILIRALEAYLPPEGP